MKHHKPNIGPWLKHMSIMQQLKAQGNLNRKYMFDNGLSNTYDYWKHHKSEFAAYDLAIVRPDPSKTPPPTGEVTRAQTHFSHTLLGFGGPPFGSYNLYRMMATNPTIAIGYNFAKSLLMLPKWDYVAKKNAPQGAKDLIQEIIEPQRQYLVEQAAQALQFGWQSFEKVFAEKDGNITLHKLKPLNPDRTKIRVDQEHGNFAGLEADLSYGLLFSDPYSNSTFLPQDKCFVFTFQYNPHDGYYGKSLFENIRAEYDRHQKITKRLGQYLDIVSSLIFLVEYQIGTGLDINGNPDRTIDHVKALIEGLSRATAVAIPNDMCDNADHMIQKGISDPSLLKKWHLNLLESNRDHSAGFESLLRYYDANLLRGLLIPERSILESAGGGTLAEAQAHTNTALMLSQQTLDSLVCQMNWHLIDQLLVYNYGESARGTIEIKAQEVNSDAKRIITELLRFYFSPQNADLTTMYVNIEKAMEMLGLPINPQLDAAKNALELIQSKQPEPNMQQSEQEKSDPTGDTNPRAKP